jgi:hypothetical protein
VHRDPDPRHRDAGPGLRPPTRRQKATLGLPSEAFAQAGRRAKGHGRSGRTGRYGLSGRLHGEKGPDGRTKPSNPSLGLPAAAGSPPSPQGSLCDNWVRAVIPSEARNLALSVFNAMRDSSSSANKNGGLLGMTCQPGYHTDSKGRELRFWLRPSCFQRKIWVEISS